MRYSRSVFLTMVTMLVGGALLGCNSGSSPMRADSHAADHDHHEGDAHQHDHPTEGPHHGQLIELGKEEYHAEWTHDDATKIVAIYILDHDAKDAVPIDAQEVTINLMVGGKPSQFTLPAIPLEGDPPGKSSRFQSADDKLCEVLDAERANGRLNLEIAGKAFSGRIAHQGHADHRY